MVPSRSPTGSLGIDFGGSQEQRSRCWLATAFVQWVRCAHRPEVADEAEHRVVANRQTLAVGDWQGKPGTLQKPAEIPHVKQGNDAGRHAAGQLDFRSA
jgi:hypothetical protein